MNEAGKAQGSTPRNVTPLDSVLGYVGWTPLVKLVRVMDGARMPVISAHQLLYAEPTIFLFVAKMSGELILCFEMKPIILALSPVELIAQAPQEIERSQQVLELGCVDESVQQEMLGTPNLPADRTRGPECGVVVT